MTMAHAVHKVDVAPGEIDRPSTLRLVTCGSVDDGKSTLIGRLLYESNVLLEDQVAALESDSRKLGTQGGALDLALLVDGLSAEREQGITIDVAHRFFATKRRSFIVADAPGHEQFNRNMATAASMADLAVILVDARKGVLTQTRRHSLVVAMLGVRHVVLAVNKMDLVGFSQAAFERIEAAYRAFAAPLGFAEIRCIPVSALNGDNVVSASRNTAWYRGPTLIDHLEAIEVEADLRQKPFRLPVQWVNRPNAEFRGYAGLVASGTLWRGDRVRVLPSGWESRVKRIVTFDGDLDAAVAGQSVTVVLEDEIDVSRGDLLCAAAEPAGLADRLVAKILWMGEEALRPGQSYLVKIGTKVLSATVSAPHYSIDVNTLDRRAASTLRINEVGVCTVELDRQVAFDPYVENRETGGFILIDCMTDNTIGLGLVEAALEDRVAANANADAAPHRAGRHDETGGASQAVSPRGVRADWRTRPHERGWRSLGKAVSWRALGTIDTLILAYIFTGDVAISLSIGMTELTTKTALYYGHERVWARVGIGLVHRDAPPPSPVGQSMLRRALNRWWQLKTVGRPL